MTPEEKPKTPVQHIGAAVAVLPDDLRQMAEAKGLVGEQGELYCWNCQSPCDWHVSLHCVPCRVETKRREPERRRIAEEARRAERERAREQQKAREAGDAAAARKFR